MDSYAKYLILLLTLNQACSQGIDSQITYHNAPIVPVLDEHGQVCCEAIVISSTEMLTVDTCQTCVNDNNQVELKFEEIYLKFPDKPGQIYNIHKMEVLNVAKSSVTSNRTDSLMKLTVFPEFDKRIKVLPIAKMDKDMVNETAMVYFYFDMPHATWTKLQSCNIEIVDKEECKREYKTWKDSYTCFKTLSPRIQKSPFHAGSPVVYNNQLIGIVLNDYDEKKEHSIFVNTVNFKIDQAPWMNYIEPKKAFLSCLLCF